jgi:hypothetical protein
MQERAWIWERGIGGGTAVGHNNTCSRMHTRLSSENKKDA